MARVLILGGAGIFGGRICRHLARSPSLQVVIAGRTEGPLRALKELVETNSGGSKPAHLIEYTQVDVHKPGALQATLAELRPKVVRWFLWNCEKAVQSHLLLHFP